MSLSFDSVHVFRPPLTKPLPRGERDLVGDGRRVTVAFFKRMKD